MKTNQTIDGKQEGVWKDYHDNGKLWSEGSYVKGEKEGTWKHYYRNGKFKESKYYIKGEELSEKQYLEQRFVW